MSTRTKHLLLIGALGAAAAYGCYSGPRLEGASSGAAVDAGAPSSAASDLPCDVARVLVASCGACHGEPPRRGANSTVTRRASLLSPFEEHASLGAAVVARMRDAATPMPPDGLLPESDIALVEAWVARGMPEGACGDAGAPVEAPVVCSSNRHWNEDDDEGSPLMSPGRACIACHDEENREHGKKHDDDDDDELEAPAFSVAGTVYRTLREPDDCFGLDAADVRVVIEGADGKVQTLRPNRAGNFSSEIPVAKPYRAKVVRGSSARVMTTAQTSGDCNACHAAEAKDAPGRIVAP